MKTKTNNFLSYILIFTIFSSGLSFNNFLEFTDLRFSYFVILFIILLWFAILKNLYFNKGFFFFIIIVIIFSLYSVCLRKNTVILLMKQVIGINLEALAFYLLLKINKYDLYKLFKIYMNIAFLIAVIGLFQEIGYLLGLKFVYDFGYLIPNWKLDISINGLLRVNSILPEPSSFCYTMLPAFYASIVSFKKNAFRFLVNWKNIIIILSFFLTFSTIGYIGVIISFLILIYNNNNIVLKVSNTLLISVLLFILFSNIGDFNIRINDSIDVIMGKTSLEEVNLSTFTLYSNALVAFNCFKDNPIIGSGLGSYRLSYQKYITRVLDIEKHDILLNKEDANSLFLRLLAETGLFGIFSFLYFILKHHLPKKNVQSSYLGVINNGIFVLFIIRIIRCGHYFIDGFFFFFWLYLFTWKMNKNKVENKTIGNNIFYNNHSF